jgi:hypothetical protein
MRRIQTLADGLAGVLLLALLITGLLSTSAFAQAGPVAAPGVEVALYPAPELYRMGGIPPGMLPQSFMAGHGRMRVIAVDDRRTRLEFDFAGLIPNGVYTLWNVLSPKPNFKDEPLGPEGWGGNAVIADPNGRAQAVVYLEKRPGVMFLLDYHADGKLTGKKGETVFPGALWAPFTRLD